MKKLIFTALAVVAFSGMSMTPKKVVKRNCATVWNVSYYYARQAGFNNEQANSIAFAAYDNCLGCD